MRVISLASGSSGNALLIEAGPQRRTKLLIDAGISTRLITKRLHSIGIHPSQLQGVLVTHEHSDHVQGLPLLVKQYTLPIITDALTYQAIEQCIMAGVWRNDSGTSVAIMEAETDTIMATDTINCIPTETKTPFPSVQETSIRPLAVGSRCQIGDIAVESFPISHDAIAPCGYLLSAGGCRVCLVTDSGEVTAAMLQAMQQADLLILEANHDRERLLRGPYPQRLKQRILSSTGHLSNDQAAEAILRTWRFDSIRWIWLSHLSRTNNTPRLALDSISSSLRSAGANLAQIHLSALPPNIGHEWDSTRLWHLPSLWEKV